MTKTLLEQIPCKRTIVALASFILIASPGLSQDTNAPTEMKPTVVTGSYIPTAETVGAAQVQTLSTEAIDQAGTADTLITLRKLVPGFTGSGNYLGNVNNNVNIGAGFQAFTGESYAAIRNLPTLVLIDGQRVASSALSGGQAVDLNSIPIAMIERIEVLKDGASAIYGSDAIGGVINVITKKNYNGFEISGRYGFPTDGPSDHGVQYQASLVMGVSTDTARFTAGAQIFEQNALLTKDRELASLGLQQAAENNLNPPAYISPSYPGKVKAGGVSYILASSPFAQGGPGYNPTLLTPPVFPGHSFSGATAVSDYNAYAIAHGYTDPTGHGLGPYVPFSLTPTGQQLNSIGAGEASGWPALNTTEFGTTTILEQDRRQFWASGEKDIFGDKLTVYSTFLYSDNYANGQLAPSPVPSLATYNIQVPGSNPYNPFQTDLGPPIGPNDNPRVRSRFVDFGNRTFVSLSDFYQWVGGLKGNITPDYGYDVSYDYSQDRQEQQTLNAVNGALLNQAFIPIGATDAQGRPLSQLTDATGNNLPVYNIFGSSLAPGSGVNAPQTIDALKTTLFTWGQTELWSAQGVFNGRPIDLPAGKLSFAVGGQYIDESIRVRVDGLSQGNLAPGLNVAVPFPFGKKTTAAGFAEVNIPIFGKDQNIPGFYSFEIDAAGRYQTFDPGGDKAVPKVGFRWQPIDDQVTLRGSYNQGFIAPTIFQLFGPAFESNPEVYLNGSLGQVTTEVQANPNLKPSNTEQFGAGIVLSPKNFIKNLTISADYYHITEDHLATADFQSVANSLDAFGAASPYAPGFTFSDGTKLTSNAPHQVTIDNWLTEVFAWQPFGALRTDGIDLAGNYVIPEDLTTGFGKISLSANANVLLSYQVSDQEGVQPYYEYKGTYTVFQGLIPDWTLHAALTWDIKDFTYVVGVNYLPPTHDPGTIFPKYGAPNNGFTVNGDPVQIPDYYTIDMQLSYEFGKHKTEGRQWYDGTKLTVGVLNLTNAKPPIIADAVEDNTDKNNYDILGRFLYFEVSKKF